jgi:hypothetical protein
MLAFARSSGATAVLAMAPEPPAHRSCSEKSHKPSRNVARQVSWYLYWLDVVLKTGSFFSGLLAIEASRLKVYGSVLQRT